MKKFWKTLMFALVGAFALTSCEDVPAPYPIPNAGGGETPTTSTFYSSTSCSDWEMLAAASGNNPWSQGASYTQATGYQKWDGADAKSNRMADGYLISPAFSTATDSASAYVSFQYCVAYANNDAQFADHIKLYASSQYDAAEGFVAEKWTQLDWKATHTSTNWELETTTVALPAEFLNKENVNIAFYFTTPNDTKSSTFEIKDLKVVAGTPAVDNGGGDTPTGAEVTCAEAANLTNELADGSTSSEVYTVTGYITEVVGSVSNNQQTFWMADTKEGGRVFEAYWANLPEGVSAFKAGMKVKITGNLMKYVKDGKVTPEIKNATVEILEDGGGSNTDTATPTGNGTKESPFNVAAAINYVQGLGADVTSPNEVYVQGVVKSNNTTEATISQYGNMNFIMIDKGYEGAEFQAYQVYGLGGKKFTSASDIKVGDEVIVYGKVVNYKGNTPETTGKGSAYVYSLNGKTEGGETPDPQPSGTPEGDGTANNPWNVAAVTQAYAANSSFYDANKEYYVKGIVTNVATFSSQYGSLSYYIADQANSTNTFYVYSGLGLEKSKFSGKSDLKAGDEVVVCGKFTVYNGTFEFQYNNYLVSLNGVTDPGDLPDNPDTPDTPEGDVTIAASGMGLSNNTAWTTVTVSGVTFTANGGGNTNTPKYFDNGTNLRMYPKNSLTIKAGKKIASVVLTCTTGSVANGNVGVNPGSVNVADPTITISGINSDTVTITNNDGSTGAASQIRITSFAISFAE